MEKFSKAERQQWRSEGVTRDRARALMEVRDGLMVELLGACRHTTDPKVARAMAAFEAVSGVVNGVFLGQDEVAEEGSDDAIGE